MKKLLALVSVLTVQAVFSATFNLKRSVHNVVDLDWESADSYEEGKKPEEGDTVVIPDGVTAKLSASTSSFSFVNKLACIVPSGGGVLEITVDEGDAVCLECAVSVYGQSDYSGKIVKRGLGSLEFASYKAVMDRTYVMDYYANICVEEGKLLLYQGGTDDKEYFYALSVRVEEGAELALCKVGRSYIKDITGRGLVTKAATGTNQQTYLYGTDHTVFDGLIVGKQIRIENYKGRHDFTCPTNDIFTIIVQGDSTCGLAVLGNTTELSSCGSGNINFGGARGRVVNLGTETQSCNKPWWIATHSILDGGTYGGVSFSGSWGSSYSADYHLRKIGIAGDHANECVAGTSIPDLITSKDYPDNPMFARYYIHKTGTGIWRFPTDKQASRRGMGVLDVENGTVRFDSIAEKGVDSSLGLANWLFADVQGLSNGVEQVSYAYVLGGAESATEGAMEYTGSTDAVCTTRPFAIRSRGRIKSETAGFSFADAFALGAGEKTLTLDSSAYQSTYEFTPNRATMLSDGRDGGVLSVEKQGSGKWMLYGTNTCTGSLFVRGGSVIIQNPGKRYRWYRFVVMENAYACNRYDTSCSSVSTNEFGVAPAQSAGEMGQTQIAEIALYDEQGINLIHGFTQNNPITQFAYDGGDARVMRPNEIALGNLGSTVNFVDPSQYLQNVCDGEPKAATGRLTASNGGIKKDDPSTHLPIVVRLPENSPPAVRLDFSCGRPQECYGDSQTYNGRNMTAFRLDASVDGLHWDLGITGSDCVDIEVPDAGYGSSFTPKWNFDGSKVDKNIVHRPESGIELTSVQASEEPSACRYAFSSYGASDGAKVQVFGEALSVSGLKVDASAAPGVLENIKLAENGMLEVVNLADRTVVADLPVNIAGLAGASNVNRWKVRINGTHSNHSCSVNSDGTIRITPAGLYLIVR
jgi:hypothetical protein